MKFKGESWGGSELSQIAFWSLRPDRLATEQKRRGKKKKGGTDRGGVNVGNSILHSYKFDKNLEEGEMGKENMKYSFRVKGQLLDEFSDGRLVEANQVNGELWWVRINQTPLLLNTMA